VKIQMLLAAAAVAALCACVNTARHYKPAGFKTVEEAQEYLPDYLYYARKLTPADWSAFYQRFPEYFDDIQMAKTLGGTLEFHPYYTAYAFKWTLDRRRLAWSEAVVRRLQEGRIEPGDDPFMVVFARGVPGRVVSTNDFELLLYKPDVALRFKDGVFLEQRVCGGCARRPDPSTSWRYYDDALSDPEIVKAAGLTPPKY